MAQGCSGSTLPRLSMPDMRGAAVQRGVQNRRVAAGLANLVATPPSPTPASPMQSRVQRARVPRPRGPLQWGATAGTEVGSHLGGSGLLYPGCPDRRPDGCVAASPGAGVCNRCDLELL